ITMLNAGNTPNVSAGEAEFVVDRRIALHENPEEAKAQILSIFDELKANDPEYEYTYDITSDRPPMNLDNDDPFIQLVARSYEQITGKTAQFMHSSGGSDAASLHAAYGYTIPLMGSADTFGDYGSGGNQERTNIEDWLTSIQYYMMIVVNALS
ncbi:MAG: M20 family metallopeptidase, partial [Clostridia bacterium]|nr:M20 family metallopeptidase [Clostridia bacterium]